MFPWKRTQIPLEQRCHQQVVWVAECANVPEKLKKRARAAARKLGPASAEMLAGLGYPEWDSPKAVRHKFPTLGHWIGARNQAVFEILYNFREDALLALRSVAFSDSGWKQSNAIEILCRFASEGLSREEILEEIKRELPRFSLYTRVCAMHLIIGQARKNTAMQAILDE